MLGGWEVYTSNEVTDARDEKYGITLNSVLDNESESTEVEAYSSEEKIFELVKSDVAENDMNPEHEVISTENEGFKSVDELDVLIRNSDDSVENEVISEAGQTLQIALPDGDNQIENVLNSIHVENNTSNEPIGTSQSVAVESQQSEGRKEDLAPTGVMVNRDYELPFAPVEWVVE